MGCCTRPRTQGGSSHAIRTGSGEKEEGNDIIITEINQRPGLYFSTCNELVFIGRTVEGTSGEAFLANRVTKSLRKLPPPSLRTDFVFDVHVFGLTYKASANQFSVLHYFLCTSNSRLLGCEVITGETDENKNRLTVSGDWELLKAKSTKQSVCCPSRKIVFVKDVAHWMVCETTEMGVKYLVVSLNMVKHKFWETKLPQCSRPETIELLDIGGGLSALSSINDRRTKFDIWVLKYLSNKEWVKKQKVSLDIVDRSVSAIQAIQSEEGGRIIIFSAIDGEGNGRNTVSGEKKLWGKHLVYYAYDMYLNQTTELGIESATKFPGKGRESEKEFSHTDDGPVVFKTLGILMENNDGKKKNHW